MVLAAHDRHARRLQVVPGEVEIPVQTLTRVMPREIVDLFHRSHANVGMKIQVLMEASCTTLHGSNNKKSWTSVAVHDDEKFYSYIETLCA